VAATRTDGFQRNVEGVEHISTAGCSTESCGTKACGKTSRKIEAQRCEKGEELAH
jgi:hypothetical protein